MKKSLNLIFILLVGFSIYFVWQVAPELYFNAGSDAYNRSDFKNSYQYLKSALMIKPHNPMIRRAYVMTLLELAPTHDVQRQVYLISQSDDDSAKLMAQIRVDKWRKQILSKIGENYISKVPFNNKILRWDLNTMPLKIYIDSQGLSIPSYYKLEIQNAFLTWGYKTKYLKFAFVDTIDEAQILVKFESNASMKNCEQGDCKYTVAQASPQLSDNLLKSMTIDFLSTNSQGKAFKPNEIYNTALHEIGHSLGIMGHSENKNDIMYMEMNPNIQYYGSGIRLALSQADLNTLGLLYKLMPDITNTSARDYNASRQFFAPIVMGDEKEVNSAKIQEALNYIKNAPVITNGYIDLAAAYAAEKDYKRALDSMNKALSFATRDDDIFIIHFNLSIIYSELKDWNSALNYAELARQKEQSAEVDALIAAINDEKGDKKAAEFSYLQAIEKSPENIDFSTDLAKLYFRQFDWVKAGKILNSLILKNPQAKKDPRVKVFGWLIFLFR